MADKAKTMGKSLTAAEKENDDDNESVGSQVTGSEEGGVIKEAGAPARFKKRQKRYEGFLKVLSGVKKNQVEKSHQQYVKCSNDMEALKEFSKQSTIYETAIGKTATIMEGMDKYLSLSIITESEKQKMLLRMLEICYFYLLVIT
jgi:hypothetical protein